MLIYSEMMVGMAFLDRVQYGKIWTRPEMIL